MGTVAETKHAVDGYRVDLPLTPYREALALQHRMVAARRSGGLDRDLVLLLEHPPVFTLGRRGGREYLTVPDERLVAAGIEVVPAERGGFITYHGPGQLVAYPVLDLQRRRLGVDRLVTSLEEAMIRTAADAGVPAGRNPRNRGVWVGAAKLGSIGIAVRHGVSYHGLALNVAPDLAPFGWIDPCGLAGVRMTSLAAAGGRMTMNEARDALAGHLADLLHLDWEALEEAALNRLMASADPRHSLPAR